MNRFMAAIPDQMALGYRRTLRSMEVWENISLWIIGGFTPRNKSAVRKLVWEILRSTQN